jgi:hypothetical protein
MSYPYTWWTKERNPYEGGVIYLSDGGTSYDWFYTGDPNKIIPYEKWKELPKPEYKIQPLPFVINNEHESRAMDKQNDKLIHGL